MEPRALYAQPASDCVPAPEQQQSSDHIAAGCRTVLIQKDQSRASTEAGRAAGAGSCFADCLQCSAAASGPKVRVLPYTSSPSGLAWHRARAER